MSNTHARALLMAVGTLVLLLGVACSPEKREWEAAGKNPSEYSYQSFLTKYPQGRHASAAKQKIEEFQFKAAEASNTREMFEAFLAQYPEGALAQAARERLDDLAWREVSESGTVDALEGYIAAHPQSRHRDEARARIDSVFASRPPELRAVRTIGFTLRQSFDEEVTGVTIGFEDVLAGLFPYFGVRKAGPEEQEDVTLNIVSQAEAYGASYSQFGFGSGTYYYTGASVSGSAVLQLPGKTTVREEFEGSVPVPHTISGGATEASGAPYAEAMRDDFPMKAARLLARAFGYAPLIAGLGSRDSAVSRASLEALKSGGTAAFELLLGALESSEMSVRVGAAEGLQGHKNTQAIAALVGVLGKAAGNASELRNAAADSLSAMGATAVPALAEASKDAAPAVREAVARALGGIRAEQSRTLLVGLLGDAEASVRGAAITALGEHRSRAAVVVLIDRLAGAAEDVRPIILSSLDRSLAQPTESGDEEESSVPSLDWDADLASRLVKTAPAMTGSAASRDRFTQLVSQVGDPALNSVVAVLKDENPKLRAWAAEVLGKIASSSAIRPLARAAADSDQNVRLEVAKALATLWETGTVEPLSRLLLDPAPEIRGQAIRGLKNAVDNSESPAELRRYLSSPPAIQALIEALAKSGPNRAEDRDAAAAVLGSIGRPAVESLISVLKSSDPFVREGAVAALGDTRDDGAVAALLAYGKDPEVQKSDDTVAQVYRALGAARNVKALEFLVAGLKGTAGSRMSAAIEGLQALGNIRAVDALVAAMTPENESAYSEIDTALRELTQEYPESEGKFDWKTWWANNRKRFGMK